MSQGSQNKQHGCVGSRAGRWPAQVAVVRHMSSHHRPFRRVRPAFVRADLDLQEALLCQGHKGRRGSEFCCPSRPLCEGRWQRHSQRHDSTVAPWQQVAVGRHAVFCDLSVHLAELLTSAELLISAIRSLFVIYSFSMQSSEPISTRMS